MIADRHERIEARHGILEDQSHFLPAELAERRGAKLQELPVPKFERTVDLRARRQEPQNRLPERRFPASRLSDDAEGLSDPKVEVDAVHGVDGTLFRRIMDLETPCFQDGLAHDRSFFRRGLMMSFRPSPRKLRPIVNRTIARPGKKEAHQIPLSIWIAPAERSRPQSGRSPLRRSPRYESAAAGRMARAALSEKITGTAMIRCKATYLQMLWMRRAQTARAASTSGPWRRERTW